MRNEKIESKQSSNGRRQEARTSEAQYIMNKGKGPRSYMRDDKRILERINERLCDNPYLDASDMEVAVENRVVFLTGAVNSREDKRLAEEIAEEITVWKMLRTDFMLH